MRRLAALLLLAACGAPLPVVAPNPGPTVPQPAADTCAAAPFAGLVGQPATALERVLIMRPIRILRPNDPVIEDFSPARLNIFVTADERIGRLTCG